MSMPPPDPPPGGNNNSAPRKLFLRGGKIVPIPRAELTKTTINVGKFGTFPRLMGIRAPAAANSNVVRPRFITPILVRPAAKTNQNAMKPGIVKIEMTPQGRRIVHSLERPPITNVLVKNSNTITSSTANMSAQMGKPSIITMSPSSMQTTQLAQGSNASNVGTSAMNKVSLGNQNNTMSGGYMMSANAPKLLKTKQQYQYQSPSAGAGTSQAFNTAYSGYLSAKQAPAEQNDAMYDGFTGINDVTHIAGINLTEEQNIALNMGPDALTELPSIQQVQFLNVAVIRDRIREAITRQGLNMSGADYEAINLISAACEQDLKNLIEKLCVNAEHRAENLRADPSYMVTKNVRGQLQFLKELDEVQERNLMEFEKQDDAKNRLEKVYKAELKEQYRRDTENTAMQAILGAKKPKLEEIHTECGVGVASSAARSWNGDRKVPKTGSSLLPFATKRIKYVTKQDVLFVLEQEPSSRFRAMLYELYLK